MKELLDLYFPIPPVTVSNGGSSAKAVSPPVDIPQLTIHMIWTDVYDQHDYGEPYPFQNFELESNSVAEAELPSPSNIGVVGSDPEAPPSRQATPDPPLELSSPLPISDSEPDLPTAPVAINRKVSKSQQEIRQQFSNSVLLQNIGQGTT
jgi:hypothetical protein